MITSTIRNVKYGLLSQILDLLGIDDVVTMGTAEDHSNKFPSA